MSGNLTAVRDFTKSQGMSCKKILSGKCCLKVFIVCCITIQVFGGSLFCVKYKIYGFRSCTVAFLSLTDSYTITGMI